MPHFHFYGAFGLVFVLCMNYMCSENFPRYYSESVFPYIQVLNINHSMQYGCKEWYRT